MIYDQLARCSTYKGISNELDRALDLMGSLDNLSLKPGKNIVDKDIYIMFLLYDTLEERSGAFEYHKQFIDIQLLLKGEEYICYSSLSVPEGEGAFDLDNDCGLFSLTDGCDVLFKPGNFSIFFPGELHAPGIAVSESRSVEKIIIKVISEINM